MFTYVVPTMFKLVGMFPKEVGNRFVFALYSNSYGGKGIPAMKENPIVNSKGGTGRQGVLLTNERNEAIMNEVVLQKFRTDGTSDHVYEETMHIFTPYI
jgi:hypothetical protein